MNLGEMNDLLGIYVDDVVAIDTAVKLLNMGQNKMATEVKARFPQLTTDVSAEFVFPNKYHELPVLYAAAMLKSMDSSVREKESYLGQFGAGLAEFAENYDPPLRYRDDEIVQQWTVVDPNVLTFSITKNTYDFVYGRLQVYVNDQPATIVSPVTDNSFTIMDTLKTGDAVTAVWEQYETYRREPAFWPGW